MSRYHKGECCVVCLQDWGDREKDIAECCCLVIEANSEPTYTQSQVNDLICADRARVIQEVFTLKEYPYVDMWGDTKYAVDKNSVLTFLSTPLEIGEGE